MICASRVFKSQVFGVVTELCVRRAPWCASWVILWIVCQHFATNTSLAQSIFDSTNTPRLVSLAEDGAARYLANEADLPERAVVMTEFTIASEGNEGKRKITGTQLYVRNDKTKFLRIRSFGIASGQSFEYESVWMGDERWIFDDTGKWMRVYKFGSPQALAGEVAEDKLGTAGVMFAPLFDPRLVWTMPSLALQFSLQTKLDDYVGNSSIQATKLNKDNSVSALFAKTNTRAVNYITEINFPRFGMPDRFVRYAAINGNFSPQKAKEAQAGVSPLITYVKWAEFERDRYVPLSASSIESNEKQTYECKFNHRWLLGSAVKDWVFEDPRDGSVELEDLEFAKPVVYLKIGAACALLVHQANFQRE